MTEGIKNEPVEIRNGSDSMLILRLYLSLRDFATEIIYRADEEPDAVLITSLIDSDYYFRPEYVKKYDLSVPEANLDEDRPESSQIDLKETWRESGEDIAEYIENIKTYKIPVEKIALSGDIETPPLLLTVEYFYPYVKQFYFNNNRLA
ncbi:MAG: hypothetical protein ABEJ02_04640 [Candidatus Paceibacteria bacterium]